MLKKINKMKKVMEKKSGVGKKTVTRIIMEMKWMGKKI